MTAAAVPTLKQTVRAACTIISPNYLAYARTLAESYRAHHPGDRFFVLLVADLSDISAFAHEPFECVALQQIGLEDLRATAMQYDILELNTNVKPSFMKFLLARYALDQLVYLDPDIFCYQALTPVFEALVDNDAVLTPHLTTPLNDDKHPGEQEMLYNGLTTWASSLCVTLPGRSLYCPGGNGVALSWDSARDGQVYLLIRNG
jgi:hypothetical protein